MQTSKRDARSQGRRNVREVDRIRRLLASEYCEFSEEILVESPFAETDRNGRGVRQVALGLTRTRLIVAADVFRRHSNNNSEYFCPRGLDPSIETFELVSVYPLEYVTLSVFGRRRRRTLKARFVDGRANYYELGGRLGKNVWKKWCDETESLLARKMDGSSLSETTAASSSSTTTLYLLSSEIELQKSGRCGKKALCRVWAHYGGAGDYAPPTWIRKDLYLGPSYEDLTNGRYTPVPVRFAGASLEDVRTELKDLSPCNGRKVCRSWPACQDLHDKKSTGYSGGLCDVLFVRDRDRKYFEGNKIFLSCQSPPCTDCRLGVFQDDEPLDKKNASFQRTIVENHRRRNEDSYVPRRSKKNSLARKVSRFGFGIPEKCNSSLILGPCRGDEDYPILRSSLARTDPRDLVDSGVKVWEGEVKGRSRCSRNRRHLRRYGLSTAPHFLRGLGPWSVQTAEREFLQTRRSLSLVTVRRRPLEPELRLPVSRRQLTATISCTALQSDKFDSIGTVNRGRVVLFWTPDYWYRPTPAATAYRELRRHLNMLKDFRQKDRQFGRKLFQRRKKSHCGGKESFLIEEKTSSLLGRIFSGNGGNKRRKRGSNECQENGTTAQLRRLLRMELRITVWDLDSDTLAMQLTLVDRDLFLRIPAEEIGIVEARRSSRNAPNLGAWIAFSHRISCLTASEVLSFKKLDTRARIIARFVNVAKKCFSMGNFQSCRSILAGLQAPPIYRLKSSWSRLRVRHSSRYEIMERLCKIFKNPCTVIYRRAWAKAEGNPPCLPYIGDLLGRIFGLQDLQSREVLQNDRGNTEMSVKREEKLKSSFHRVNLGIDPKIRVSAVIERRGLTRRIVESVLCKLRLKTRERRLNEEEEEEEGVTRVLWRQDLARKYFYRWKNVVLRSKLRAKEEERKRNMDPRGKRVLEVASWLTDCQRYARAYEFPRHSYACEFLLKARYREDRDNFFVSLDLEPPKVA